jgi:hypothetical protein
MKPGQLEAGLDNFDAVRELVNNYCSVLGLHPSERLKVHVWSSGSLDKASVHMQVVQCMLRPRVSVLNELIEVERRGVALMLALGVLPLDGGKSAPPSLPDRILHHARSQALEAMRRQLTRVNGYPLNSLWQDPAVREGWGVRDCRTIEFAMRLLRTDRQGISTELEKASPVESRDRQARVWLMLVDLTFNCSISFMEKSAPPPPPPRWCAVEAPPTPNHLPHAGDRDAANAALSAARQDTLELERRCMEKARQVCSA